MKKFLSALLIMLFSASFLFSQNEEEMKKENDKGISAGMAMAWLSYNNEQYYDALRTYKNLYKRDYISV